MREHHLIQVRLCQFKHILFSFNKKGYLYILVVGYETTLHKLYKENIGFSEYISYHFYKETGLFLQ